MRKNETLEELLIEIRRVSKGRTKGAEKKIKKAYEKVLYQLQHFLANEYLQMSEDDILTYDIIRKYSEYANFLENVQRHIDSITPTISTLITQAVKDTYKIAYDGLVNAVKVSGNLENELKSVRACTVEMIKRAVENPIAGLTLKDTIERNRKDIIYHIKQQIGIGLTNGDRYSTMATRIKVVLENDYEKSICIARTETHRVRESGSLDAAIKVDEELRNTGRILKKQWKTMEDSRVRPNKSKKKTYNHIKMNGIIISVNEEFVLPSGTRTKAPGNSGVAGEDINCRCYLSYRLEDKKE